MIGHEILNHAFNRWSIKILCVGTAILLYLLFRVNTLTEREAAILLDVISPRDYIVSSDYPSSINVTLRGNEEAVKGVLIDDIEASVNLSAYSQEGTYRVPVEINKKGTALQPEALEVRPQSRELSFSLERKTIRSLIVHPELSGFPALGYELTQSFVSPSSVTVIGPYSQMENLYELNTEIIDISGRREDFTVTTRVVHPSPQIEIPGGQIVEFRGVIKETIVIRTIENRELVVFDLPEGLSINSELPQVSLTVQGSQLIVEEISPQDMTLFIEGSKIRGPGTYTLPLMIDIPPGLAVLKIAPREISIQVVWTSAVNPQPILPRLNGTPSTKSDQ